MDVYKAQTKQKLSKQCKTFLKVVSFLILQRKTLPSFSLYLWLNKNYKSRCETKKQTQFKARLILSCKSQAKSYLSKNNRCRFETAKNNNNYSTKLKK